LKNRQGARTGTAFELLASFAFKTHVAAT
jgi:hypothetical protein